MNEMESKYQPTISSTTYRKDVLSMMRSEILSKTDFNPISIARQAPGADKIVAMAGVFKACTVTDWKEAKEEALADE